MCDYEKIKIVNKSDTRMTEVGKLPFASCFILNNTVFMVIKNIKVKEPGAGKVSVLDLKEAVVLEFPEDTVVQNVRATLEVEAVYKKDNPVKAYYKA